MYFIRKVQSYLFYEAIDMIQNPSMPILHMKRLQMKRSQMKRSQMKRKRISDIDSHSNSYANNERNIHRLQKNRKKRLFSKTTDQRFLRNQVEETLSYHWDR